MKPVLLALRALGIGDLATVVPSLRALRRAFPRHELVLAAPAALTPLVSGVGAVDRIFPTGSFVREPIDELRWSGPRPDIAVNLHGRGPQSHRALLATDPVRFIGYARPEAGWPDGPEWADNEAERVRWCRLLHAHGIPADACDLGLEAPPPVPEWAGAVVVHPGASGPERRWPVPRFAAVARRLAAAGHRVLISGSPGEAADAHELAAAAGLPPAAVLAGRTDLGALAALIAHARLLICGDTGVAHLATAYGTRSVLLFGPVSPALWGPPPRRRHTVLWRGPQGLERIGVDEVYEAACAQLAAAAGDELTTVLTARPGDVRDAAAAI
ncbi:glycosyltransferase family 9 protein [Planosporangium thailandense]|uniref:Glycosyltransferase family 9 protein n=1 Tax=Planosporangium thailandense TaxID=765197 RepID=A0ABX0XY93_9ACTN|nr:glycosyltransferase family 9 protein [Planosporangium thailandense]